MSERPEQEATAVAPVGEEPVERPVSDEEFRRELIAELDDLSERVRAATPDYEPPPFSARRLMALIEENLRGLPEKAQLGFLDQLRSSLGVDVFDVDVWKGAWYLLNYTVQYQADLVKRRFTGDYDTDEWGLDWEFVDAVRPFFSFLYKVYWRVEVSGLENIPLDGRALLVANHSGQIPWDSTMVGTAVLTQHPAQRLVRTLYSDVFPSLPFFSTWLVRMGQTLASVENGTRLLEQDELVAVFPEGQKGSGKPYRNRYHLARFGRGGFVQMAMGTQAQIIPVSVVGSEETYISLGNSSILANVTGLPYVPITMRFPWLGLLGLVPLPTKWYIDFGQPIPLDRYGPDATTNLVLVSQITDHVRNVVQEMVNERLATRRSVFF